jgi:DNA-binding CsgD family transcriptional regulator
VKLVDPLAAPWLRVMEMAASPVAAIDARRVIAYVNPAFRAEFGVTLADVIGLDALAELPGPERSRLLDEWRAWRRGEPRLVRILLPHAARPGLHSYFVLPAPIRGATGRFVGVVATLLPGAGFPVKPEADAGRRALAALARHIRAAAAGAREPALERGRDPLPGVALTAREAAIAKLLARGDRVPNIAQALRIRPVTVRNHLKAIFRKADVHSQRELLARLNRAG